MYIALVEAKNDLAIHLVKGSYYYFYSRVEDEI